MTTKRDTSLNDLKDVHISNRLVSGIGGYLMDKGEVLYMKTPLEVYWSPKDDITTKELADALPFALGYRLIHSEEEIPGSIRRHFEIKDPNK